MIIGHQISPTLIWCLPYRICTLVISPIISVFPHYSKAPFPSIFYPELSPGSDVWKLDMKSNPNITPWRVQMVALEKFAHCFSKLMFPVLCLVCPACDERSVVSRPAELWIQRVVKATANLKENNTTWDTYLKENKRRKFKENNTTTATNLKEN